MAQELDTQPKQNTPEAWAAYWSDQMKAADKRLRKFAKQGVAVNQRFLSDNTTGVDRELDSAAAGGRLSRTNFFHTNIQTLSAQLYGAVPKIDVGRQFNDPSDDVARVAALLLQRILTAEVTASDESFPTALRSALQDRLLPGLGVCRVRYDMDTVTEEILNPLTGAMEEIEKIAREEAPVVYTHWQDFRWGWCRVWSELPWCAFRSYLDKETAIKRFGEDVANTLEYEEQSASGVDKNDDANSADQKNNVQTAQVWEIWRKSDRKVFWWSSGCPKILDSKDDPLELTNFWPMPRPLMANLTTSLMVPKADYIFAQDIYNEIDILATRISNITAACKVVGVYDASAGTSVGRMLTEGNENMLIPVEQWAVLAEKGGLKGVIDWFPVEDIAAVLGLLNAQLNDTKGLLYEVTGMSDIVSGGKTDEYTSDGTNRLKAKFGSIKIQSFQDEFARFASDLESIKAEVISKHFQPKTILQQSSAQYLTEVDRQYIQPAVQLIQSPEMRWRVTIKPESISLADYAELKSERVEYMTAVGTFLQSAKPIVSEVPGSAPLILEMLKFGLSAFKGAEYMEGLLDQAIDAAVKAEEEPAEEENPEAERAQADMAKIEAKKAADIEVTTIKAELESQKIQLDNQADISVIAAKSEADSRKQAEELAADQQLTQNKRSADLSIENAQSTYSIAEKEVELRNQLTLLRAEHERVLVEMSAQASVAEKAAKQTEYDDDE
tara:strand:- start:475 stop:2649 length:2175 start_codon:yes stop_codon:yes gene_type:complete